LKIAKVSMSTIWYVDNFFQGTRILTCPRFKDQTNIGRYRYKRKILLEKRYEPKESKYYIMSYLFGVENIRLIIERKTTTPKEKT